MNTVRERDLSKYAVGDVVCDMHYGTAPLAECFRVVEHVKWAEWDSLKYRDAAAPAGDASTTFSAYLTAFVNQVTGRFYGNKMLIVLSVDYIEDKPYVLAGYSYDGRQNGIVILTPLP